MSVSAVAAIVSVACIVAVALGSTSAGTALPDAEEQTKPVSRTSKEMSMSELAVVLDDDMLCECEKQCIDGTSASMCARQVENRTKKY